MYKNGKRFDLFFNEQKMSYEIDISRVTIEDPVRDPEGRLISSITYNGMPLKVRVPIGLVTGFHGKEPNFQHIHGRDEVVPGATLHCNIGFSGCDPYGKERSASDSSTARIYNFVLSLQDQIVDQCVKNGIKLFGKNKSEGAIREGLVCIRTFAKMDNGNLVVSGEGRPYIRPTIAYSEMEQHGDVEMGMCAPCGGPAFTPVARVSPNVATREFYVTPHLLILPSYGNHIVWKMGYVCAT
jgi:hypothetical protein